MFSYIGSAKFKPSNTELTHFLFLNKWVTDVGTAGKIAKVGKVLVETEVEKYQTKYLGPDLHWAQ